jgi:positive regulator of sigma E activity
MKIMAADAIMVYLFAFVTVVLTAAAANVLQGNYQSEIPTIIGTGCLVIAAFTLIITIHKLDKLKWGS